MTHLGGPKPKRSRKREARLMRATQQKAMRNARRAIHDEPFRIARLPNSLEEEEQIWQKALEKATLEGHQNKKRRAARAREIMAEAIAEAKQFVRAPITGQTIVRPTLPPDGMKVTPAGIAIAPQGIRHVSAPGEGKRLIVTPYEAGV